MRFFKIIHLPGLAAMIVSFAGAAGVVSAADLDSSARELLRTRCADCHYSGEKDGRKGKRPLLDGSLTREGLAQLTASDKSTPLIKLGDPAGSQLIKSVSYPADDDDRMPESTERNPRDPLTATEVDLLARWIRGEGSAGAAESARPFMREADVMRLVRDDLAAHPAAAKDFRYLTLHNLWNLGAAAEPDAGFALYRAAVAKLLNSLSWSPDIVPLEPIDPQSLVFRVRLSAYAWRGGDAGWDEWREIASRYPYAFAVDKEDPEFVRLAAELRRFTGVAEPVVVRADWFVFACAQPPLYDELLYRRHAPQVVDGRMPADVALEQKLGVDVAANLRASLTTGPDLFDELVGRPALPAGPQAVLRAGFDQSGVSRANRLVERHAVADGRAYWKSYDFNEARSFDVGNLVMFPLGPVGAGLSTRHEFKHDGGEMIFHLPNGLQGYLLTTAKGQRLATAPIEPVIVEDQTTFRAGRPIANGISCIVCHDAGMKRPPNLDANGRARDVVRPSTQLALLTETERKALRHLYVEPEVLHAAFETDSARFAAALRALGADGMQPEPVGALYARFLRPLDTATLLAELDIEPTPAIVTRFPLAMRKSAEPVVVAKAMLLLGGSGVKRVEFLELFRVMAEEFGRKKLRSFRATEFTEFGSLISKPRPLPNPDHRTSPVPVDDDAWRESARALLGGRTFEARNDTFSSTISFSGDLRNVELISKNNYTPPEHFLGRVTSFDATTQSVTVRWHRKATTKKEYDRSERQLVERPVVTTIDVVTEFSLALSGTQLKVVSSGGLNIQPTLDRR